MPSSPFTLRTAVAADAAAIEALIKRSVHALQAADYTQAQREAALGSVFLVDQGLITDGTCLVAETPTAGWPVRAAGRTARRGMAVRCTVTRASGWTPL